VAILSMERESGGDGRRRERVKLEVEEVAVESRGDVEHVVVRGKVVHTPPVASFRFLIVFRNESGGLSLHLTDDKRMCGDEMREEERGRPTEFVTAMTFKLSKEAGGFMRTFGNVRHTSGASL